MAGIELKDFSEGLSTHFSVPNISTARVMPNIAMRVGSGCSGNQKYKFLTVKQTLKIG